VGHPGRPPAPENLRQASLGHPPVERGTRFDRATRLQDLVDAGYLKQLPKDPFTNTRESWVPITDDSIMSPNQSQPGIIDVHSGSDQKSSEGTAYSSW